MLAAKNSRERIEARATAAATSDGCTEASRDGSLAGTVIRSSIPAGMAKSERAVVVLQFLAAGPVAGSEIDLIGQDDKARAAGADGDVVHYEADPEDLSQTARGHIRLNRTATAAFKFKVSALDCTACSESATF
jgi:hypothetical protein